MKLNKFAWFAITIFVLASLVQAQEKGVDLKMSDNLTVRAPAGWRLTNQMRDSAAIYIPLRRDRKLQSGGTDKNPKPEFVIASEAGMLIMIERRRDHNEAVRRLAEISSEYPETVSRLIIAGWPAIERRYRALMPQPGEDDMSRGNIQTSFTTTAIAVGDTVVRFDTMFAPDADPSWLPLGAPASNSPGKKNFTPDFPAYPSGHATFGAASLDIARRFLKAEKLEGKIKDFCFVSSEFDGVTQDNQGTVRPRHTRLFAGNLDAIVDAMIVENGLSRIYLGVHWSFDAFGKLKPNGSVDPSIYLGGAPLGLKVSESIFKNGIVPTKMSPAC